MDNNLTLRRRHITSQMSSSNEEDTKSRARRGLFSMKQMQALLVMVFSLAIVSYISTSSLVELSASNEPGGISTSKQIEHANKASDLAPPKDFDCAIFWLRMPKTASTTIAQTFIRPIFRQGNFSVIELGPNSCITHVGGCAPYWKQTSPMRGNMRQRGNAGIHIESMNARRRAGGARRLNSASNIQYVPPFGRNAPISKQQSTINQRCFPSADNQKNGRSIQCHEYDPITSTLNYGKRPPVRGKKQPSRVRAQFNAGPRITTHVGIDPSLFGWIMPPNPMVFSTFRDPLERIFSSFHYGIQFGGGRPGDVGKCDLPGVKNAPVQEKVKLWEEKVVKAREIATLQNNTVTYQNLLRQYLKTCEVAVDNAYVQFLDPDTKDVNVAIQNLEEYVIVGLQSEMGETLSRWVNITRRSCKSHEHFGKMEKVFTGIFDGMTEDGEVKKFRESKITLNEAVQAQRRLSVVQHIINQDNEDEDEDVNVDHTKPSTGISLVSPDFNSLDDDLKDMISRFTAGDQKVWKRVLELYELQKDWGKLK